MDNNFSNISISFSKYKKILFLTSTDILGLFPLLNNIDLIREIKGDGNKVTNTFLNQMIEYIFRTILFFGIEKLL